MPRDEREYLIGRSPASDNELSDMTVSWRHAELRPSAGHWVLADLDSKNGTHVNGWRAGAGFTVRAGDWVRFGRARFRVTE
jgi:pSer/pThr/pTyr-binding forkhead associated (FHA) protein